MAELRINGQRLWDSLMETARIGGTPAGGVSRLALSDADAEVRRWFKNQCTGLGCAVAIDAVGNIFAMRRGRRSDLPPIAMGSHLDTQPGGGKFDGILGVLAGIEVLRTLEEHCYETNAPTMVVDWTNEEGSRFPPAMLGSGVYAGIFEEAFADSRADRQGVSFRQALEAIGYRGKVKPGSIPIGAMFELHIEQGPILEAENKEIGIVNGVQGARWYEIEVKGRAAHTGSTPMRMRRNALLGAARIISRVDEIALEHGPGGLGAVGLMEVRPNSRNVVPAQVLFTVDFRHPDDDAMAQMEAKLFAAVREAAGALDLEATATKIWDSPTVHFDPECIKLVRDAAQERGFTIREMISGPGHDAKYVAKVAPTAMIFIPCEGGLSHNELERTTPEQCAAGAQVLLDAVLGYDARFG